MATDKRSYPNSYFAWYNDDDRVAIIVQGSSTSSSCSISTYDNKTDCEANGGNWITAGESTNEKYDTYSGSSITGGLRLHTHSKYGTVEQITDDLKSHSGVDVALQHLIIDYVKSRLLEDGGDLQRAMYYKGKYEKALKIHPHRKSGVRTLAVPRL